MNAKRKITPHKGGRTENIFVRVRPIIKRKFVELCNGKSQGDLIEELIEREHERQSSVH